MRHEDLPVRWKTRLKEYINQQLADKDRARPVAGDFRHHVKIAFADGSFAFFDYAFYVLDREGGEVVVFTEHCGHHIFPLRGTTLESLASQWSDIGDE